MDAGLFEQSGQKINLIMISCHLFEGLCSQSTLKAHVLQQLQPCCVHQLATGSCPIAAHSFMLSSNMRHALDPDASIEQMYVFY